MEHFFGPFWDRLSVYPQPELVSFMYFHWLLMKLGLPFALKKANRTEQSVLLIKRSKLHACIGFPSRWLQGANKMN